MIQFQQPTIQTGITNVRIHELKCLKSKDQFQVDKIYNCYIQKMDTRFMVYTSSGISTCYSVFKSQNEIEDHFNEL